MWFGLRTVPTQGLLSHVCSSKDMAAPSMHQHEHCTTRLVIGLFLFFECFPQESPSPVPELNEMEANSLWAAT